MDKGTILKKLGYVGVLNFATVDKDGCPQVRCISAIHYEPDAIYFYTARGKDFCQELLADGHVQVMGYTRFKEMIRLSAVARPVADSEQERWKDIIFGEQPYLGNVYPGDTRDIGIVFCIRDMEIEYFNLGAHPIFRQNYASGNATIRQKGFRITEDCIGCGTCRTGCPQKAIDEGSPYHIRQENCLRCGRCQEKCPAGAIQRS